MNRSWESPWTPKTPEQTAAMRAEASRWDARGDHARATMLRDAADRYDAEREQVQ